MRSLAAGVVVLALLAAPAAAACRLTPAGSAEVIAVRDGRTLALSGGRELRLAAIEAGDDTRPLLESLVGTFVRIERLGAEEDRYGRLVGFVFGSSGTTVQETLLDRGLARVSARIGDKACADALLAREQGARKAGRGLWADPNFALLPADNLPRLQAERGRFALVEGKVLSVRESGATIYVNFGRRWTRDFSVTIPRRQKSAFAAVGLAPEKLEGRRIRVRGWLEQRSGPIIEATAPEQIEFAE